MNYEKVRRKLDLKAIYGLMLSKMGLYTIRFYNRIRLSGKNFSKKKIPICYDDADIYHLRK